MENNIFSGQIQAEAYQQNCLHGAAGTVYEKNCRYPDARLTVDNHGQQPSLQTDIYRHPDELAWS